MHTVSFDLESGDLESSPHEGSPMIAQSVAKIPAVQDWDMTEAERIAHQLRRLLPHLRSGSLRFWGRSFGRPHDNRHLIVGGGAQGDLLRVRFDAGETLSVEAPQAAVIDARTFRIEDARRVRWEWFHYGKPRTRQNLYFEEFTRDGPTIVVATNVDRRGPPPGADPSQPAVEMR
jgi:hypothetical protein